jgi:hypothetical protein
MSQSPKDAAEQMLQFHLQSREGGTWFVGANEEEIRIIWAIVLLVITVVCCVRIIHPLLTQEASVLSVVLTVLALSLFTWDTKNGRLGAGSIKLMAMLVLVDAIQWMIQDSNSSLHHPDEDEDYMTATVMIEENR